jgi:hypothetical protein
MNATFARVSTPPSRLCTKAGSTREGMTNSCRSGDTQAFGSNVTNLVSAIGYCFSNPLAKDHCVAYVGILVAPASSRDTLANAVAS